MRNNWIVPNGRRSHQTWSHHFFYDIFVIADYPHKLSHYIGPISFQCFAFLLVPLRIFRWFHFGCSDLPMVYCPTLQIMILLVMTKSYKHLNTWLFSQMGSPPTNVKTNCSGKFDGKFPILMSLARLHPNSQEVQGWRDNFLFKPSYWIWKGDLKGGFLAEKLPASFFLGALIMPSLIVFLSLTVSSRANIIKYPPWN